MCEKWNAEVSTNSFVLSNTGVTGTVIGIAIFLPC